MATSFSTLNIDFPIYIHVNLTWNLNVKSVVSNMSKLFVNSQYADIIASTSYHTVKWVSHSCSLQMWKFIQNTGTESDCFNSTQTATASFKSLLYDPNYPWCLGFSAWSRSLVRKKKAIYSSISDDKALGEWDCLVWVIVRRKECQFLQTCFKFETVKIMHYILRLL